MATNFDFIKYLTEQINCVGDVSFKKMFGEYMIYVNAKPIFIICDNTLFVKVLPSIEELMEGKEIGKPYSSCKQPHYIVDDVDDKAFLCQLAIELEKVTQIPKPRKKRATAGNVDKSS